MTFLRRLITLTILLLAVGAPARASVLYDFRWDAPTGLGSPAGVYAFTFEVPNLLTTATTIGPPLLLATSDPLADDFIGSVIIEFPLGGFSGFLPGVQMNFPGPNSLNEIRIGAWSGAFRPGVHTSIVPGTPTLTITESSSAVPEPASILLLGTGIVALVAKARHRRTSVHSQTA
jgi:PEP-CTERM motif-containing protein